MNDDPRSSLESTHHPADVATRLAAERTVMAADRSLMAWIRTALSMISFGFTIYKVLQSLQQGAILPVRFESPRMGLFLTALGTLTMTMGAIEYGYRLKGLRPFAHIRLVSPALIMAFIMSLTGLALFVSISGRLV